MSREKFRERGSKILKNWKQYGDCPSRMPRNADGATHRSERVAGGATLPSQQHLYRRHRQTVANTTERTVQHHHHDFQNSNMGLLTPARDGHRGFGPLPRGRLPREPPQVGQRPEYSLFVDGVHRNMEKGWLHDVFSEYGRVVDIFISRKRRRSNPDEAFAFVRFSKKKEAEMAIDKLDQTMIKGKTLRVSMARYNKMGKVVSDPVRREDTLVRRKNGGRKIAHSAFRDERQYAEVVLGRQSENIRQQQGTKGHVHLNPVGTEKARTGIRSRNPTSTRGEHFCTIQVPVNDNMVEKLHKAVVLEFDEWRDPTKLVELAVGTEVSFECMSHISHSKLIVFFGTEDQVMNAINKESPLWSVCKRVCRWDNESGAIMERTVWVECTGIHPIWWGEGNIRGLGERWGRVAKVEGEVNGINSLTYARMLITTHQQETIDAIIRVEWPSGSCLVSLKEVGSGGCWKHQEQHYREDDEESEWVEEIPEEDRGGPSVEVAASDKVFDFQSGQNVEVIYPTLECNNQGIATATRTNGLCVLPSIDEWWAGHTSCPVQQNWEERLDPMATIECTLLLDDDLRRGNAVGENGVAELSQARRPRGRPKRMASSLPDTLSVPTTPSLCSGEAGETWHTAWTLGIGCRKVNKVDAVHDELRRSKRILVMEEGATASAR
ncbi:unnamed protein product [Amaranthus hypochondriacus]